MFHRRKGIDLFFYEPGSIGALQGRRIKKIELAKK